LEQIFEVNTTKERLKEHIKQLHDAAAKHQEQEKNFFQYSSAFSKVH
jgi:hypothetical protein